MTPVPAQYSAQAGRCHRGANAAARRGPTCQLGLQVTECRLSIGWKKDVGYFNDALSARCHGPNRCHPARGSYCLKR